MSASSIKKLILILIALVLTAGLASCSSAPGNNTVTVPALTYAEYAAASDEAKVVIEGYLQSYALVYGDTRVSMFLQDDDGAYYVYLAVCDAEKANQLEIGKLIRVTGVKGSYAGEREVQEQSTFEILSGSKIYDPADITSLLGSEPTLEKMMNRRVCLKGLVIRESYGKDDASCAYLYNWDGSGKAGDNNDVYFSASHGEDYSLFVVESDEYQEGSSVYSSAVSVSVGDVVDLEGFLYWYNGPNIHVSSMKITRSSKAELSKGSGVMTREAFLAAYDGEEAVIEAYVQGLCDYDEERGRFSAYLADADGAYFAKGITADKSVYESLSEGSMIRVSGYRATENGMPLMAEGCTMQLLEGYYIAPVENITSLIGDSDALSAMAGQKVYVKGLTASSPAADGLIQAYDANGKQYGFVIVPEELPEGSTAETAAGQLAPGAVIDLTCFVSLDPEPQFRVQRLTVRK